MSYYKHIILQILLFTFIFVHSTLTAGTTGKISGFVVDKVTGEPLVGVNILVSGTSLGAATHLDGSYFILNISPGTYTLRASMIGYGIVNVSNITVKMDFTSPVDFQLSSKVIEGQEVTVVAQKKLIQKDLTASTSIVSADDFEKLPVTEISEALELQAGYVNGHLRGGRSGEVAYWIDGVPVTDVFNGETVIDINTNSVSEMQLISGAFNAEYGQAMSGIVNIVTKDGRDKFEGNLSIYSGDFYSKNNNLFWNIDQFNPITTQNYEANFQGSILPGKLFFQGSIRWIYYQGPYEGLRTYDPASYTLLFEDEEGEKQPYIVGSHPETDSILVHAYLSEQGYSENEIEESIDSTLQLIQSIHEGNSGDGSYVPMDWNLKKYGQIKFIYKFSPLLKLKYTLFNDHVKSQNYNRSFKLNPDGDLTHYKTGLTHLLQLHHSINGQTFYTLSFTQFNKKYSHKTYSEKNENLYVHSDFGVTEPYSFMTSGTNNNLFSRQTVTSTGKIDFTSQINRQHMIKFGLEYRQHHLDYKNINLQPPEDKIAINPFVDGGYLDKPKTYPDSTVHSSSYEYSPIEFSTYIQDKVEYDDLIINAGIRFDYFDPKAFVPADPSDPSIYNPIRPENRYIDLNENGVQDVGEPSVTLNDRETYWFTTTHSKWKISPRFGFSFPISDQGVFHFSYGHFFQIPRFELLYQNPDYDLGQGTGNVGLVGNPDLRPEKTISGELGLQQQLNRYLTLDATGYFRDIRDLTGTRSAEIVMFGGSSKYSQFENSDFAFIRGIVLSLGFHNIQRWNGDINYTYQIAKGTASDPDQARASITGSQLPEVHLIPLNWDQRHTLSGAMMYSKKNWGGSMIIQCGSGLPYTPESTEDISTFITNSSRKPITWTVDFRSYYQPKLLQNSTLFFRVKNVFDRLNHLGVYNDSGRADETINRTRAIKTAPSEAINSLDDWFNNETFYSQPRRIEFGINYDF